MERTAIKDCHAVGLHSIIINESPKIRLFITERDCDLNDYSNYLNLEDFAIPIHAHKYQDTFVPLYGDLRQHIFTVPELHETRLCFGINKYTYSRLDKDLGIEYLGAEKLRYEGSFRANEPYILDADVLHTVTVTNKNNGFCAAWLVIEGEENHNFTNICYHPDLQKKEGLYNKFESLDEVMKDFFDRLEYATTNKLFDYKQAIKSKWDLESHFGIANQFKNIRYPNYHPNDKEDDNDQ